MPERTDADFLELEKVEAHEQAQNVTLLRMQTNKGNFQCRWHKAKGKRAILWVFGSGGGLGGPAGGIYERLATNFLAENISSLELDYRRPESYQDCIMDVLLGIKFLSSQGIDETTLVGHSFGGAVVITAGAISERVIAVAALSSQTSGTELVSDLAPKPLLLIHGTADEILPDSCSRRIYANAKEPKELILYEGCRHGLDQCRDELDADLTKWLIKIFAI